MMYQVGLRLPESALLTGLRAHDAPVITVTPPHRQTYSPNEIWQYLVQYFVRCDIVTAKTYDIVRC